VEPTRRYWLAAGLCAVLPDLDAIGRPFGALDLELIAGGHRGFTHSIAFAVALGATFAWGVFRDARWDGLRTRFWLCFSLATMTHGFLDALTTNGDGVKFLSPFSDERFTSVWHPIDPGGAAAGARTLARIPLILGNELLWVALPCAAFVGGMALLRRRRGVRSVS
jgi:inner membrane protein